MKDDLKFTKTTMKIEGDRNLYSFTFEKNEEVDEDTKRIEPEQSEPEV